MSLHFCCGAVVGGPFAGGLPSVFLRTFFFSLFFFSAAAETDMIVCPATLGQEDKPGIFVRLRLTSAGTLTRTATRIDGFHYGSRRTCFLGTFD